MKDKKQKVKDDATIGNTNIHKYNLKERIKKLIKLLIFLTIIAICFGKINNIVKRKFAYQKTYDFFEQKEYFDVLFFGSSHMYTSIYPMQLWKDYGIVSYNMGQTSSTLAISYYNLLLACKETKPKIIVIDSFLVTENYKIANGNYYNSMHNTFDVYPLSYEKYLAIKDLCGTEELLNKFMEYLFNFSIYHARWNELSRVDFEYKNKYEKGAETRVAVREPNEMNSFDNVDIFDKDETINMKYLRKIIEYCKENNIEILVTYNPYPAPNEDIAASKYVKTICDEYNVNYINFLEDNIVNYDIDCYDKNSHLNASGARKVTDYLGRYIMENYDIPAQRENESYSFWNEDYDEYINLKIDNLKKNEKNLNNYLMLLYDEEDIKYEIKISSKQKIEEGSTLKKLLENINNNYEIDDTVFNEKQDKTIKITTWDNRTEKELSTIWF